LNKHYRVVRCAAGTTSFAAPEPAKRRAQSGRQTVTALLGALAVTAGGVAAPAFSQQAPDVNDTNDTATNEEIKYFHTTSSLADSTASGTDSTAIGPVAKASGTNTLAIGSNARATSELATALGGSASARGLGDLALGTAATAAGDGTYATAAGAHAQAAAPGASALGANTVVTGSYGTAAGYGAAAGGENAAALGSYASASGMYATALGTVATASGINAFALGSYAQASGDYAAALGNTATAHGQGDVALGTWSEAAGSGSYALAAGARAQALAAGAVALGPYASATGDSGTAAGYGASAAADNAVALGRFASAATANSVALGNGAVTDTAVASTGDTIGGTSYTYAGSAPIGVISVGVTGSERQITHVAAGRVASASTDAVNGSQLYATNSQVTKNTSDIANLQLTIADLSGDTANAVKYDSSAHDAITLGGANTASAVMVRNLAAGTADSDAVNVAQLNAALAEIADNPGGASDPLFAADGNRTTEAAVARGRYATAAGANALASGTQSTALGANALANGAQSTALGAQASATGANAIALGTSATAAAANSVALGYGSVADRDGVVSVGSRGTERQIANVAAGTQATDAVNVTQLNNALNTLASNTASQIEQGVQQANAYTNQQLSVVRRQMNALGATAMAAAAMVPNARAEGNVQMSVAAGTYGGESALALGAHWYVSNRLLVNARVARSTSSGGSTGAAVGATFGF
jgi:autotransporter adhesin